MPAVDGRACKRSRAGRREQWRQRVAAQSGSGLSAAAYCREHGLGVNSFYRWRRIFEAEGGSSASAGGIGDSPVSSEPRFAELRIVGTGLAPGGAASGVELVLSGERRLRLSPNFDVETLQRAVAALESLPC